jgi:hypothetical protein
LLVLPSTAAVTVAAACGSVTSHRAKASRNRSSENRARTRLDGRGVGRLRAGEAQGVFEDPPMVGGPPLEAGEVGLAAEQAEERQGEDRGERVADASRLAGVVDPSEGVEQRREWSGHP